MEPDGHVGGAESGGGVAAGAAVLPQSGAVFPGSARIEEDGFAAGEAHLPAVGVTAEVEVDAVVRSDASELGGVGEQDGESTLRNAAGGAGEIIAAVAVGSSTPATQTRSPRRSRA